MQLDEDKIHRLGQLAKLTLAVTLGVILWGSFVRASGSGAGCGSHWPTCNGEIIPHPKSFKTLVEVTHRITSGLDLLLVVALAVCSFRWLPKGHPGRTAGALSLFFMLTEAAVGAGIVLLEYVAQNASIARALWMGVHLTNTFLLLGALGASVTRSARVILFWESTSAKIKRPPMRKRCSITLNCCRISRPMPIILPSTSVPRTRSACVNSRDAEPCANC